MTGAFAAADALAALLEELLVRVDVPAPLQLVLARPLHRLAGGDLDAARGAAPSLQTQAELAQARRDNATLQARLEALEHMVARGSLAVDQHKPLPPDDEPAPTVTVKPTKGRK